MFLQSSNVFTHLVCCVLCVYHICKEIAILYTYLTKYILIMYL